MSVPSHRNTASTDASHTFCHQVSTIWTNVLRFVSFGDKFKQVQDNFSEKDCLVIKLNFQVASDGIIDTTIAINHKNKDILASAGWLNDSISDRELNHANG